MGTFGKSLAVWLAVAAALVISPSPLAQDTASTPVKLEQIISREDPAFSCFHAIMNVGRDGNVYLGLGGDFSYIMRLSPDGKSKSAASPGIGAMHNAIANGDGVLAAAHAHFEASVYFYNKNVQAVNQVGGFLVGDAIGWDACAHVDVGANGDFYAMDQHRDRVLRITPQGKVIKEIPIGTDMEDKALSLGQMHRVCEKTESLYVLSRAGHIRVMGFDGKKKWEIEAGVNPYAHGGGYGGFDVDDDGTLYVLKVNKTTVQMYDVSGGEAGEIELNMGEHAPASDGGYSRIAALSVRGDEIFVKRVHHTELFQRYDKASGQLKNVVHTEHERLSVEYPGEVWQAGQAIDFTIAFDTGGQVIKPNWKVWARNFGDTNWRELAWKDNKLQVPADLVGVVHIKVSPELQPQVRGSQSEYLVQSLVAVVRPDTVGTAVVATEGNRLWYGRGEAIPVQVHSAFLPNLPRSPTMPEITLRLVTADGKVLASGKGTIDSAKPIDFLLPAGLTNALAPGRYRLELEHKQLTCVGKSIEIGPGMSPMTFRTIRYGDYNPVFPQDHGRTVFDGTDSVANYLAYLNRIGINFLSDRMGMKGYQWGTLDGAGGSEGVEAMAKRLSDAGVMPAEAFGWQPQYLQLLAGYSAHGIEQMPVLLLMDAGLPIGTGFDGRSPGEIVADLQHLTQIFAPYPTFTGWIFGNNWWVYNQTGGDGARNDDATPDNLDGSINEERRNAYLAAEAEAKGNGTWNPVLDQVATHRWTLITRASEMFRAEVDKIVQGKTASAGGPYRNLQHYPPISHAKLDVIDLQAQFEQIDAPYHAPHAVDYMRRPGKPMLSHPEVWNDDGTGGQILSTIFAVAMRGSDSIGFSGNIPNWGTQPEDSRLADTGMASIYRALFTTMRSYGPWLVTLQNNDRVAIIVERRMQTIDVWTHEMPQHFARLHEAYVSCLHAHHPATFVFAEEATAETLKPFKALLLVDQQVELEPKLKATLEAAAAVGTTIFYDKTCRAQFMPKSAKPLDVAFDKISSKSHQSGDDAAYIRFPEWVKQNVPALSKALSAVTAPVATTDNPEVLMSERVSGGGRYLWVVNNTTPDVDPGTIWRVTLVQTARVPVVANIKLHQPTAAIYDVFAGKRVELSKDGTVETDLRTLPARLYAMLDEPIAGVKVVPSLSFGLAGQGDVKEEPFDGVKMTTADADRVNRRMPKLVANVAVVNQDGKPLAASVPVRVRLLTADGKVLDEKTIAVRARAESRAEFTFPLGTGLFPEDEPLTIEATELFSGITSRVKSNDYEAFKNSLSDEQKKQQAEGKNVLYDMPAVMNAAKAGTSTSPLFIPAEQSFGPHLRNMVVSADGKTVLMNAMNWDENLYALNVEDGKTAWSKKIGHYFAVAPQPFGGGFAAQGYDLQSAQGYHLYTMDAAGKVDKRFALFGLPKRLTHRFVPNLLADRINNFAVATDGRWVAAAGDMGLAVWGRDGKVLFQQDWHKTGRHTARLAAIDNKTLLVVEGLTATAYTVADGKPVWRVPDLFPNGEVRQITVSRDGKTVALLSTCQGGRVFILRDGKLLRAIPTAAEEFDLTTDGSMLAVVVGNQLKLYLIAEGLKWIYSGDASMRLPRFARDAKRLVATSDLGTVYVFDQAGTMLMERDFGAKAVPAWLDNGDLLLATWMGKVCQLDGATYNVKWQRLLQPTGRDTAARPLGDDKTPTVAMGGWTSNLDKPLPTDAANNLLAKTRAHIRFIPSGGWGGWAQLQHDSALLYDGKMSPPPTPWLDWANVGFFAETSPVNYLLIDAFRVNMKVTAVTLVEDKAHPESWLRDASLEYWDAADEQWKPAVALLSDAAVHSHKLPQPISAARWRIMMPWGLVGNLRLGQIVFHGELTDCSHPDVAVKRPVAVLFDEGNDLADSQFVHHRNGLGFDITSAAKSGNRSLVLEADKIASPPHHGQFGSTIHNWDFEIVERPKDGQYRYAQFAWKAGDEKTTGISIRFVTAENTSVTFFAGSTKEEHGAMEKVGDSVPSEWTVVRVDLWKHFGGPVRIQSMTLGAVGGAACFDEILLGKTEEALPKK